MSTTFPIQYSGDQLIRYKLLEFLRHTVITLSREDYSKPIETIAVVKREGALQLHERVPFYAAEWL